jgi:uncharacterized protein
MKKIIFAILTLASLQALAQTPGPVVDNKVHKIVMQVSAGDSLQQFAVITQLRNIREAWPNAAVEVVCHSGGLDMLTASKSKVSAQISALSSQGITFDACNNTMKRRNVKKEDLLAPSIIVPSGMLQLVTRQEEKWAYVKGGL